MKIKNKSREKNHEKIHGPSCAGLIRGNEKSCAYMPSKTKTVEKLINPS